MTVWQTIKSYFFKDNAPRQTVLVNPFDTPERRGWFVGSVINNILENPDQVLGRYASGEGLALYRKMETTDPVIASALSTRRAAVINRSYTIA